MAQQLYKRDRLKQSLADCIQRGLTDAEILAFTKSNMHGAILKALPQVRRRIAAADSPAPETYRGWSVTWDYGYFTATSPDYDASWEGEEDGWRDNGLRRQGRTMDELRAEVDEWFEENGQFGVGA